MSNKGKSTDKAARKAPTKNQVQRQKPAAQTAPTELSALHGPVDNAAQLSPADLNDLQQTYGNSYVQRVSRHSSAANHSAGKSSASAVQRSEDKTQGGEVSEDLEARIQSSQGRGHALPDDLRGQMEGQLGAGFGDVTLHTDNEADALNRSLKAEAFTVGSDIYFRKDSYNPGSPQGQQLLAHELTHVMQQGGSQPQPEAGSAGSAPTGAPAAENEAAAESIEQTKEAQKEKTEELKTPEQEKAEAKKENQNEVIPETQKEEQSGEAEEKQAETKKQTRVPGPEAAEKAAGASASELADQKFEAVADQEADSDIRPLLPTWSELAAGTIQLSADQAEELTAHCEVETEEGNAATAIENIDQSELANDALKEGVIAGLQEGAANLVMSTMMQLVSQKVPVADGIMAGAALISDPEAWWKEEGTEGHSKRFLAIGKAFGSIADEDNDWGRAAAFFEGVIAIVDFASRLINTISNVLSIIYAVAFPLSFAPFIGPFFTAVVSYISPLLPPLGTITLKLDITKMVLSLIAGFLRYMDLLETQADPQQLMEKQAKLQKHVQSFVSEATTQLGEKGKDKYIEHRQNKKLEHAESLPEAHPDKIHIVEKYDYKGQDTVAEWRARRQADADIKAKAAEVKQKKQEVASASDADRPARQAELDALNHDYGVMRKNHKKRLEQQAAVAERDRTQADHDALAAANKPEDQKLLDKELHGLKHRTGQEKKKSAFERWNMHRKQRAEAAMARTHERESRRDYETQRKKIGSERADQADLQQRSDVADTVDAARLQSTNSQRTERESHARLLEAQDTHKRRAQREQDLQRSATRSDRSAQQQDRAAANAARDMQATDRRIAELEAKRADVEDSSSIDSQIATLRQRKAALETRKQQAEAEANVARDAAAEARQQALVERQRVEAAEQHMNETRRDYEEKKLARETAETEQKKLEDTLKYIDAREKWERDKLKNEEFVLTPAEKQEYDRLKSELKRKAEQSPPEPVTPEQIERMRYLERMAQWQRRSDRSFSGQNKDYWAAKRYVQYRFGGLEVKEWIGKALPGGELAKDGDWAQKYGAGAIKISVNLYTITQASEPTQAEAEALIEAQGADKGQQFEEFDIKVKAANGKEFAVEPKKATNETPIDFWLGKQEDSSPTVMVYPGTTTITAAEKSGAKPFSKWTDGETVDVEKGKSEAVQIDYFKYQKDASATTPVLRREDPALLGEPAGLQRRPEAQEQMPATGNNEPGPFDGGLEDFLQMLALLTEEEEMGEAEMAALLPALDLEGTEEPDTTPLGTDTPETDEPFPLQEMLAESEADLAEEPTTDDEFAAEEEAASEGDNGESESDWPLDPANGLPVPPYETFDRMSELAFAHRQLEAARLGQTVDEEVAAMMALDAQSQAQELAGTRGMVQANQTAIGLHNQDIDEKLAAQKEMEQASAGEQSAAQQGQQQSGQGHDMFSAMFMPLLTAMGLGQAHAGTGDQKGSVHETKDGMGQQAEAGRAGVDLTTMGAAVSKQRQGETLRAQQQTRLEEKRLRDLDAQLAADQDKALEGQAEFAMLTEGTGTTQSEIIAEQDNLADSYAEANDYAQAWADEHYTVRQELFGDLESELDE